MLTTDIASADEFGRFLNIMEAINALYNFFEELAGTQEGNLCVTRDDVFFQWNEYDSIEGLNAPKLDNGKFAAGCL